MQVQITEASLFSEWLAFAANRSVVECDFFKPNDSLVEELLGAFSTQRLTAFGEHASGSIISFYSKEENPEAGNISVAWLDSEGAPCIVVSKNFGEFLSLIPYGMGFIYTVAAAIENDLGDPEILARARQRVNKTAAELLSEASQRFIDHSDLMNWLTSHNVAADADPVATIVNAHDQNTDLTPWIAENLS